MNAVRRAVSSLLLCLLLCLPAWVQAPVAAHDPPKAADVMLAVQADAAIRLARDIAIPRYVALVAATGRQETAWRTACTSARGMEGGVKALSTRYREAADTWSSVEIIHYGPIGDNLRYDRMAYWPERRNAVGRALAAQLSAPVSPTVERLRQASVAAQGFTALERLLFGEDGKGPERVGAVAERRQRCALGLAIAVNLARIAQETLAGWQGPQGLLARLERQDPGDVREALTRFVTDALALLETIKDTKIGLVLGKGGADAARSELAEGWRAGRSLRAIALNIDSVADCIKAMLAGEPDAAPWLIAAGDSARRLAGTIAPATLGDAASDPKRRFKVLLLRDAVETWRLVATDPIAQHLGVTIGFNSSDGD